MKTERRVILDGIVVKIIKPDLDGDGKINGVETFVQKTGSEDLLEISQPTELGESLRELNEDKIDGVTKMSSMDMRSRLAKMEIGSIMALDTLVAMRFLPQKTINITRQKKRLSVSESGLGRKEIVELVAGKRENDERKGMGGFGDRIKGMFGMKNGDVK